MGTSRVQSACEHVNKRRRRLVAPGDRRGAANTFRSSLIPFTLSPPLTHSGNPEDVLSEHFVS